MTCLFLFLCFASNPTKYQPELGTDSSFQSRSYSKPYIDSRIKVWSKHFRLSPNIVRGFIHQESNWNHTARSYLGAKGLMQLMDGTAKWLGKKPEESLFNPDTNIYYGCKYLRYLLDKIPVPSQAVMAYYAGPAIVEKTYVHSLLSETSKYFNKVFNNSLMYMDMENAVL